MPSVPLFWGLSNFSSPGDIVNATLSIVQDVGQQVWFLIVTEKVITSTAFCCTFETEQRIMI